ncbi:putative 115 kDa protein in type-1 retrotransposable element [Lachnellula hyalina]|uniref:Putative 115 kDa protein in type-1 retrotransposable element n=1 Tax=Lachnellula hyalina TaxID=1316788 RepID=A0A8H8TUB0_9HELO|nr:putative 115 kDa protein in type-1 retrotransposable element [Lachnellula hyalina]TVY22092.1 putative 115 kDa protein in type-1 retrotransposable element [Lachnellula hyalina]
MAYIARSYRPKVVLASDSLNDSDFQVLDVIDQDHQLLLPLDSVFCGDFNAYNPWWDPLYEACDKEGNMLADWIDYHDLALLNTPEANEYRPYTSASIHSQSHLGLGYNWTKFREKLFCQLSPLQNELQAYSYILSSNSSLKSLEQINAKRSYEATLDRLDDMAERYTSAILYAAYDAIPQIRACNIYFQAIKTAKKDHWNQFLEKEDSKSIFKALAYMKSRRLELVLNLKLSATYFTLFPPPPETASPKWTLYTALDQWQWLKLAPDEVKQACSSEIKSTSPGLDYITQTIITHAFSVCPSQISLLFKTLVNTSYHPKCWRQANCAILRKNNKLDYKQPSAYQPISLLNCLGKVSKRILAKRLAYLAETTLNLLHPSQISGRLKKSAIDVGAMLADYIHINRLQNKITSTLLLDVKGAYNHMSKNRLLIILKDLAFPDLVIKWVLSFISRRSLKLLFNG